MRRRTLLLLGVLISVSVLPVPAAAKVDPSERWQWSLAQIDAEPGWDFSRGAGVTIGVVDTGVDLLHEDLRDRVVAHTNCVGAAGEPDRCRGSGQDDHGHGTHVAGIAVAERGNGVGISGVAPEARLIAVKALDSTGAGMRDDVIAGVKWAVDHGAQVVNLSLGDSDTVVHAAASLVGGPNSFQQAVDYAWERGAVLVIAAGNHNSFGLGLEGPWHADVNAVMVGATAESRRVARYSGATGAAKWALLAPGGSDDFHLTHNVLSTFWASGHHDTYGYLAGTSMAAPHVAGALALLVSGGMPVREAVGRLLRTADRSVHCGTNSPTCRGLLDVAAAVDFGQGTRPR